MPVNTATTKMNVTTAIWRYQDPAGDWRWAYHGDAIDISNDELDRGTREGVFDQPITQFDGTYPPGTPFINPDMTDLLTTSAAGAALAAPLLTARHSPNEIAQHFEHTGKVLTATESDPEPVSVSPETTDTRAGTAATTVDLEGPHDIRAGRIEDCLTAIDDLNIPRVYGAPKVREALRAAGHVFANDIIAEAVRTRKLPAQPTS